MSSSNLASQNNHSNIRKQGSGDGCAVLFGLFFFLIGVFTVTYALGFNPIPIRNNGVPVAFFWVIGIPFTIVGFVVAFGRSQIRLDRRQGILTTTRGVPFFVKRTRIPFQSILRVQFDYIPGSSKTPKSFPVRLVLEKPYETILYSSISDYPKSLAIAKDLCRFLNKPLEDISGGQSLLWAPACLEENLRDRVKRLGEDIHSLPARPSEMQTKVQETWEGLVLEIPSPWSGVTKVLPQIQERLAGTRVVASSECLRIEGRANTSAHSRIQDNVNVKIPVTALRSLNVATALSTVKKNTPTDKENVSNLAVSIAKGLGSLGIAAQSETEFVQFGIGLPEEEAVYLHALLKRVLAG